MRGLSQIQGRAIVVLFAIPVVLAVFAIFWVNHTVTANNHKFCQVVSGVTAVPVPKPADPAANPSRENQYEWYERFVSLGRSLGC